MPDRNLIDLWMMLDVVLKDLLFGCIERPRTRVHKRMCQSLAALATSGVRIFV